MLKRLLITLGVILIGFPAILGLIIGLSYRGTTEENIPAITNTVMEQPVSAIGYEWKAPVLGGIMHKDFSRNATLEATDVGLLEEPHITAEGPTGYKTTAFVIKGNQTIWQGDVDDLSTLTFIDNGRYQMELQSVKETESAAGYGQFFYRVTFKVQVEPRMETSAGDSDLVVLRQGDVLAVRLYNLTGSVEPIGQDDTGTIPFVPTGEGIMTGYVGAGYSREPGEYTMKVTAGSYTWDVNYIVEAANYGSQALTIDPYSQQLNEANTEQAQNEFTQRVESLQDTFDKKRYWIGAFLMPVEGSVTGDYGALQYLNGADYVYKRNAGVDIDTAEGAEVRAPNSGRVVFAAKLDYTGNTVVIEHGGGLKSYFYHMAQLNVQEGNTVLQGDIIGLAGMTGYTYQFPHLRYEVRLGTQTLNPTMLFVETSGLFYYEQEDKDAGETESRRIVVPESSSVAEEEDSAAGTSWDTPVA